MKPIEDLDRTIRLSRYLAPDAPDQAIVDTLKSTTVAIMGTVRRVLLAHE